MTKKLRQKFENEKSFFIIFKSISVARNCLIPESVPLTLLRMGYFGVAHGWGGDRVKKAPSLKSITHPAVMKLIP